MVDSDYLLEKFPGKGGWTYAAIPEILQNKNNPFGWVTVKGSIDAYELKQYKLMPMGNQQLFLPVRAEIRKKIGKEAGDFVRIVLYEDETPLEVPEELIDCLKSESQMIYQVFTQLSEGKKKTYIDWIYQAKTDDTKVKRIAAMIDDILKGAK